MLNALRANLRKELTIVVGYFVHDIKLGVSLLSSVTPSWNSQQPTMEITVT
jgi:hypothetical protein